MRTSNYRATYAFTRPKSIFDSVWEKILSLVQRFLAHSAMVFFLFVSAALFLVSAHASANEKSTSLESVVFSYVNNEDKVTKGRTQWAISEKEGLGFSYSLLGDGSWTILFGNVSSGLLQFYGGEDGKPGSCGCSTTFNFQFADLGPPENSYPWLSILEGNPPQYWKQVSPTEWTSSNGGCGDLTNSYNMTFATGENGSLAPVSYSRREYDFIQGQCMGSNFAYNTFTGLQSPGFETVSDAVTKILTAQCQQPNPKCRTFQ